MTKAVIIGDGPGGLSAGLFLAKNDMDVDIFGTDDTPMHKAMLYNYLGIDEISGTEFQQVARGQVEAFGGALHAAKIEEVDLEDGGFLVTTTDGDAYRADYLIVAVSNKALLDQVGIDRGGGGGASVDRNGRTNVSGAYAIGWAARANKIQAIISAGDGAAAALDILSEEAGEDVHDFDVVD